MSNARTHAIRSHRSKRAYKPINKAMCHAQARERKDIRKFVRTAANGKEWFDRLLKGGA